MHTKNRLTNLRLLAFSKPLLAFGGFILTALPASRAATIVQTNSQNASTDSWNAAAPWGGAAPVSGNDYVSNPTAAGAFTATATGLGVSVTSRVRNTGATVFGGNTLTIVAGTELLLRSTGGPTNTANLILDDGTVRVVGGTTLAGSIVVSDTGIVGLGGTNTLALTSALLGAGTLELRASDGSPTIRLSGDLSGFTGTLQIGGGDLGHVVVDFDQDYNLLAGLVMGTFSTQDVLNLDQAITVNSFEFGSTFLAPATYSASDLNTAFGSGAQFTGSGTLTVIPEPSSALLGILGSFFFFRRRRA